MERYAPRYDARALTCIQMAVSCIGFRRSRCRSASCGCRTAGRSGARIGVTGVFAGALGFLVATWIQARTTAARAALAFTLEAPFAALFGCCSIGDRLGWTGWTGCAVILAGIALAEPAAADTLVRLVRRQEAA